MKLYKALKEKKNLIGDIANLKKQLKEKNSYLEGSKNGENFDAQTAYDELLSTIDELTGLKFVINEANREIQAKIYVLGEYKALIAFWNEVSVVEGAQLAGYADKVQNYNVKFDEIQRDKIVAAFQIKVDALQDEIDQYNFVTEVPWGDMTDEELDVLEANNSEAKENCDCEKNNCCGHDDSDRKE